MSYTWMVGSYMYSVNMAISTVNFVYQLKGLLKSVNPDIGFIKWKHGHNVINNK